MSIDFGEKRLTNESIHVTLGLSINYLTIFRLIYKLFNPTPPLGNNIFPGQNKKLNKIIFFYMHHS